MFRLPIGPVAVRWAASGFVKGAARDVGLGRPVAIHPKSFVSVPTLVKLVVVIAIDEISAPEAAPDCKLELAIPVVILAVSRRDDAALDGNNGVDVNDDLDARAAEEILLPDVIGPE